MSGLQERWQPGTSGAPTGGNVQKAVAAPPRTPAKEMQIAFSTGGRTDVALIPRSISLNDFFGQLSWPEVGSKDGSYYIRGGDLLAPKRSDENLKSAELIILDGDSRIDPETGEVTPGAPPMQDVTDILDKIEIAYIAHTTHSYKADEHFWKYRVIIPAFVQTPEILSDCVEYFIDTLHDCGVWLNDVPENRRWSQPWYLPRVATEADLKAFLCVSNFDAGIFDYARATKWVARKRAEDAVLEAAKKAAPAVLLSRAQGPSIIDDFNKSHDLVWVRAELEGQGYRFSHFSAAKGTYRYIAPRSETGEAGLVVFQGAQGDWCTYSHHGSHDPLSGRLTDPFGLSTTFHHGGDVKAAVRANKAAHEPAFTRHSMAGTSETQVGRKIGKLRVLSVADAMQQNLQATYIVKALINSREMSIWYGQPGSGKSFWLLYIFYAIAQGAMVLGKRVRQTKVLYLSLEATTGIAKRIKALVHDRGECDVFHYIAQSVNFSAPGDVDNLIEVIEELGVGVVVIDTMARALQGANENDGEDMGRFIAAVDKIKNVTGCHVAIVHHAGKDDSRGMRGHSSLLGAADVVIEIIGQVGARTATLKKNKEDVSGTAFGFDLNVVELGIDEDGDIVTTCVATETDAAPITKSSKLSKIAQGYLRDITNHFADPDTKITNKAPEKGMPVMKCTTRDALREHLLRVGRFTVSSGKPLTATDRSAFKRNLETLRDNGKIGIFENDIWLIN